jgi:predicted RNA methylase
MGRVLPFMQAHPALFRDQRVLEIGTGSGIISLYAAKLGATAIVATDISDPAVACARDNARRLGYASILDVRRVPESNPTAYSVIRDGERFDLLISNPPYSLDIEAPRNTAVTETGELGFSIVRGLRQHLTPQGRAVLYYNSLFYHHVMVKFARREGFEVRSHQPDTLTPWEATTLFNSYLDRFLPRQGLQPGDLRFEYGEDLGRISVAAPFEPLLADGRAGPYPGMMVISMAPKGDSPARRD